MTRKTRFSKWVRNVVPRWWNTMTCEECDEKEKLNRAFKKESEVEG